MRRAALILDAGTLRDRVSAGGCRVRAGELVDAAGLTAEEMAQCAFEGGSGFMFRVVDEAQADAHPAKPKRREKRREENPVITPTVEVIAAADPTGEGAVVKSVVGATPADLRAVLPDAAGADGMTVLLAGVAVLGGGAAWKFYSGYAKQKHEQAMARIESEKRAHEKCDAARAALERKVGDLADQLLTNARKLEEAARLLDEQRQQNAALRNFDPDDLAERVETVEKALRKTRRR